MFINGVFHALEDDRHDDDGADDDQDDNSDDDDGADEDKGSEDSDGEDSKKDENTDETVILTQAELDQRIKDAEKAARKDQDKRWKDRNKGKKKSDDDDSDDEGDDSDDDVRDERYDRLELKTDGFTDKKEQDIILDIARYKKVSASEAAKTPAAKAEIKAYRDKAATPSPSRRSGRGTQSGSVEFYAQEFAKGRSAPTREMRRKVRQFLREQG